MEEEDEEKSVAAFSVSGVVENGLRSERISCESPIRGYPTVFRSFVVSPPYDIGKLGFLSTIFCRRSWVGDPLFEYATGLHCKVFGVRTRFPFPNPLPLILSIIFFCVSINVEYLCLWNVSSTSLFKKHSYLAMIHTSSMMYSIRLSCLRFFFQKNETPHKTQYSMAQYGKCFVLVMMCVRNLSCREEIESWRCSLTTASFCIRHNFLLDYFFYSSIRK